MTTKGKTRPDDDEPKDLKPADFHVSTSFTVLVYRVPDKVHIFIIKNAYFFTKSNV